MIRSMSSKIRTDTALDAAEKQLLNIATVPIYKILQSRPMRITR
jgi:conjugative transfer pilus assembly protein TraH